MNITPSITAKRFFVLSVTATCSLRVNISYQSGDGFSHLIDTFGHDEFTRGRKQRKHGGGTRFNVKASSDPFGNKPSFNVSALAFTVMLIIWHVNSFIFLGRIPCDCHRFLLQ